MNREEVMEYLLDFHKRALPELVERELTLAETGTKKITAVIGPRRVGKTFFLYQKIRELSLDSGMESILYLNFEDPRLLETSFKDVREVVKLHWELYPGTSNPCIFIDEPQNIEKWESAVRALHDEGFNIYLSGSSARLLSKEIATALRGRSISYILLPFSFREFLRAKKANFYPRQLSSKEKAALLSLLGEYLELGGFPEITLQ